MTKKEITWKHLVNDDKYIGSINDVDIFEIWCIYSKYIDNYGYEKDYELIDFNYHNFTVGTVDECKLKANELIYGT